MEQNETARSDRELVARIAAADEHALALLYDRFGNLAYSLAYQILGDTADAEEIVTDAFVQVWTTAASFDPARASAGSWVAMIARTRALDRLRSRRRRAQLIERVASGTGGTEQTAMPLSAMGEPERDAEQADLRTRVAQSLAGLPDNQRQVVELAFFRGLSHSEIAGVLNEPLGTVKTRVRAAMSKLRAVLAPYQLVE